MKIPLSLPKLVAHRGWRSRCPENTIIAYQEAVRVGARYVECDLQLTRDLEPVLYHDVTLDRVSGVEGTVFDHRWETLKKIKAGEASRFGQTHAYINEPIAHLKDFVTFLQQHPQVRAFVEMKQESLDRYGLASVLPRVMEALSPVKHQCELISFSLEWCQAVRKGTHYPVGFIAESLEQLDLPQVKALRGEFECVNYKELPPEGSVTRNGSALFCWEISDPGLAVDLHARGLDFVETYEIGEMLKAFSQLS